MPLLADTARQMAAALTVMALVIVGLVLGSSVLIPLAGAAIIAFMLSPIVRWIDARGVPHPASVALVLSTTVAMLVAVTVLLSAELLGVTARLDDYKQNLVTKAREIAALGRDDGVIKRASDAIDRLGEEIEREVERVRGAKTGQPAVVVREATGEGARLSAVERVMHTATEVGLTLLFSLFLLLQHQDLRDRIVRVLGTDNMSETTGAMTEAGTRLSQLFLAQALLNLGYGVFAGVVLWIIGVPGALVWAALASLMRFVPFVGSFIAALPPILLAAGVEPGWTLVIVTALFFLVSESATGHLIEPLVLGRSVGLSPLALIAAASFWTLLWGPIGLLLAAPLTISIVVMGRYLPGLSFLSVLLGDEPALSPEQELYHRLLSADVVAASDEIDSMRNEGTLAAALDHVVLPALRLASADLRVGRLAQERAAELRATLQEAFSDLLEEHPPPRPNGEGRPRVLVIAGRGEIDLAAAGVLADLIAASFDFDVTSSRRATGLTALADGGQGETAPAVVVVVSVGGVPGRQLQLMAERAGRSFPGCRVVTVAAAQPGEDIQRDARDHPSGLKLESVVELMSVLNAVASSTPRGPADATALRAEVS